MPNVVIQHLQERSHFHFFSRHHEEELISDGKVIMIMDIDIHVHLVPIDILKSIA